MAEEESERNIVTVSLLKCRKTGDTSITDRIKYDSKTGLFIEEFESVEPNENAHAF
jgi:hypothetical protein